MVRARCAAYHLGFSCFRGLGHSGPHVGPALEGDDLDGPDGWGLWLPGVPGWAQVPPMVRARVMEEVDLRAEPQALSRRLPC